MNGERLSALLPTRYKNRIFTPSQRTSELIFLATFGIMDSRPCGKEKRKRNKSIKKIIIRQGYFGLTYLFILPDTVVTLSAVTLMYVEFHDLLTL